jgi:hypothetical protein
MTPYDQMMRDLTLERYNGGGWRPTKPDRPAWTDTPLAADPEAEQHRAILTDYVTDQPARHLRAVKRSA